MPCLRLPRISLRFYASLCVVATIFYILDTGTFLLRHSIKESPRRRRLGRSWLFFMARLTLRYLKGVGILECDLTALTALQTERGLILVANHPSRLDSLILASALPHMTCVTKASICAWQHSAHCGLPKARYSFTLARASNHQPERRRTTAFISRRYTL